LLYVGSINKQDGVDHIVQAIHNLIYTLEQKNIYCSIVGDGESLSDIRLLARQLSVDQYIDFPGFIHDRTSVINYIRNADICLESASNNDANKKSTFIKIMEYMACSKPIVAYDLAETRFSVGSGGILVPPGNFYAFSEAISDLVNDIEKRRILGAIARERIINGLNWESSATKLLESYSAVLKNCQHTPKSS
jgi:glycosyltransferase involved in cell wall biosynthesis